MGDLRTRSGRAWAAAAGSGRPPAECQPAACGGEPAAAEFPGGSRGPNCWQHAPQDRQRHGVPDAVAMAEFAMCKTEQGCVYHTVAALVGALLRPRCGSPTHLDPIGALQRLRRLQRQHDYATRASSACGAGHARSLRNCTRPCGVRAWRGHTRSEAGCQPSHNRSWTGGGGTPRTSTCSRLCPKAASTRCRVCVVNLSLLPHGPNSLVGRVRSGVLRSFSSYVSSQGCGFCGRAKWAHCGVDGLAGI
jgi:hypothetical protein